MPTSNPSTSSVATSRGGAASPWLLGAAVLLFLVMRGYILFGFRPDSSDALGLYSQYAIQGVDLGRTPYKDFAIEYPPVAWWAVAAPRWIDPAKVAAGALPHQVRQAQRRYHIVFRMEMFLCEMIALVLLVATFRRRRPELAGVAALSYVLSTAILAHLLYDRLDAGLFVLLAAWAYCWVRSLEPECSSAWGTASYLMLGLSISFKLVPILMTPFLLLAEWHAPRRWRNLGLGVLALAVGAVGPFAVHFPSAGWDTLKFLQFHATRGLQLESLPSSLLMLLSLRGLPVRVVHPYGGFDLDSPVAPAVKTAFTALLLGFLAILGIKALVEWTRYSRERAYDFSLLAIGMAVILATVLSPQYFVWTFPLMLLLGVELLTFNSTVALAVAVFAIALLSTWLFPYHYFEDDVPSLTKLDRAAIIVLAVRNGLYLGVMVWLGIMLFWRRTETTR